MRTSALARCCAALMPLLLMACAAANSIHYSFPGVKGSRVITVDAKQRHLVMTRDKDDNVRACAEAAPDVFSALSSSFSGGGAFGPTDREVDAAYSIAETAATIERTQTINLLRESFYRTCERWLSGALSHEQLIVQAARDQNAMLKIMAIEQLTGTTRGRATIISGPSTSASLANGEKVAALITELNTEYTQARNAQAEASTALDAANNTGRCKTLDDKPADVAEDVWTQCRTAKATLALRDAAVKDVKTRLDSVLSAAESLAAGGAAGTTAIAMQAGAAAKPDPATIKAVAAVVESIVNQPAIDETLMFCIAYLGRANTEKNPLDDATVGICNRVLGKAAEQELEYRGMLLGDREAGAGSAIITRTDPPMARAQRMIHQLDAKLENAGDDTVAQQGWEHFLAIMEIPADAWNCRTKLACRQLLLSNEALFKQRFLSASNAKFQASLEKF